MRCDYGCSYSNICDLCQEETVQIHQSEGINLLMAKLRDLWGDDSVMLENVERVASDLKDTL